MDNNKPENQEWVDEILGAVESAAEIGPDETAVSAAGLTHPDDLELEKILAEDWGSDEAAPAPAPAAEDATRQFTPPQPDGGAPTPPPAGEPAPEQAQQEAPKPRPRRKRETQERKGRPQRKGGYGLLGIPHMVSTVIWLLIVVSIGVALGRTLWVCCADLLAFGKPDQQVTISVTASDDLDSVAKKLADADLVRYPELFKMFARMTGKDADISVGTHTLNSKYDYNAMINSMADYGYVREEVEVMIPEGYNCAQIFRLLEERGVCTVAELEAYAANGELGNYWFLEGVPRGNRYCLEGYLFPDTYKFYKDDEPRRVLEKFLDDFDYRFTDRMRNNLAEMQQRWENMLANRGYGQTYINQRKLTLHQVITLASIIEEETAGATESYTISSVFYNRLAHPDFPRLDSDATVYYAIGAYFEHEELTASDINFDSPYNTRRAGGIPPGPISNPGLYSIYAALDPDDTSYYYFIYDPSIGGHRFSKTEYEHNNWANKLGY